MSEKTVRTPSAKSYSDSEMIQKIRTLQAGTDAMRAAGTKYLQREERETDKDYQNKLDRSVLFPALAKAVTDTADFVFRKDVQMGDDVPDRIMEMGKNINNEGQTLTGFARDVFEDGLQAGISFVLVDAPRFVQADAPREPENITVAQENEMGYRPYAVMIKAENVLGWKTEPRGADTVLTQLRILEWKAEDDPKNRYEQVMVEQVRVLDLIDGKVNVEIHRKSTERAGKEKWVIHDEYLTDIPVITIVPFYADRKAYFLAEPPFKYLADLNVKHWQLSSGYDRALDKSFIPVPVFSGFDMEEFVSSPDMAVFSSDPSAKASYLEVRGDSLPRGEARIKDIEQQMAALGLRLIIPKTGNVTATGEALDTVKVDTPLSYLASSLQQTFTQVFEYFALYLGDPERIGGTAIVNKDFGLGMLSQVDLNLLLKAVTTKNLSLETFIRELMRREILADDINVEEELMRIAEELAAEAADGMDLTGNDAGAP